MSIDAVAPRRSDDPDGSLAAATTAAAVLPSLLERATPVREFERLDVLHDRAAVSTVVDAMESPDLVTRWAAARRLVDLASVDIATATRLLTQALDDPCRAVRHESVNTLAIRGGELPTGLLRRVVRTALTDSAVTLQRDARVLVALASVLADPDAVATGILADLASGHPSKLAEAGTRLRALANVDASRARPIIEAALADDDPAVRETGAGALSLLPYPAVAMLVHRATRDADEDVRRRGFEAMVVANAAQDPLGTLEDLTSGLRRPDVTERLVAVWGLGACAPYAAADAAIAFETALADSDDDVAGTARALLERTARGRPALGLALVGGALHPVGGGIAVRTAVAALRGLRGADPVLAAALLGSALGSSDMLLTDDRLERLAAVFQAAPDLASTSTWQVAAA